MRNKEKPQDEKKWQLFAVHPGPWPDSVSFSLRQIVCYSDKFWSYLSLLHKIWRCSDSGTSTRSTTDTVKFAALCTSEGMC